ncbi:reverse transcriptase domain-containing protein [Tanacetum coccineum]|uniref:Reverse transcriptase domain-containing protein n=1 Tax=Tanacetum coccineum TaxID=301880 RepID=A0ABQ5EQT1_9ASTR
MKKVIVELSLLTTPVKDEMLYVYLTAATEAVSAVLIAERKGVQFPIHYEAMKAKYEALLAGLRMARKMKVRNIDVKVDSKLVASQINRSYVANNTNMIKYLATTKECIAEFETFAIQNIPRNLNQKADILSKLATHAFDHLTKKVLVEVLAERSTDQKEVGAIVEEEEDNWMTPIIRCQLHHPGDPHRIMRNAHRRKDAFLLSEARLDDSCGDSLDRSCLRWPATVCIQWRQIEVHASVPRRPKMLMTSIMAPWPFYQWEMDILRPLPQASKKLKFVIVAIDYFTKWIEAKPLVRITGKDVKKFVWENIVCRFRLPRIIVTDNRTQFVNNPFKGWCESLNIKQMNTVVVHPQANGLVERANKSLIEGIKARLRRERAGWVDELPNVLWAHPEIGMPTHRTMMIKEDENEDELRLNMDLLRERREALAIREAMYKTRMEQYYNQKVRPTSFKSDEYVFRRNEASRVEDQGKLGPKWEGPYRVTEAYQNGSYKLQTMGGKEVPRTWHTINLRKCYV